MNIDAIECILCHALGHLRLADYGGDGVRTLVCDSCGRENTVSVGDATILSALQRLTHRQKLMMPRGYEPL